MVYAKQTGKQNIGLNISLIIFVFICANIILLIFYSDVWWDSSVYIGMGKYIFSLGKSGLWEESRPLILPSILGAGWILNFNVVYFGRAISIIFAVLVILIIYKLGIKIFSKEIALLAAFFTAFSYNFLFFSSNILTEIPSTLFVLMSVYYFLDKKFFLMGMFSGIAVMTRFFQVFTLIGLYLVFLIYFFRKPNFYKKSVYIIIGALLFVLPYIMLNYSLYGNVLLPLQVQSHLTKTTGWEHYKEYGFYFIGLLKENFFVIFLLTLPFFFKKTYKFSTLVFIPLVYFIIFSFVKHKEMRFMLAIFPFLYLLTAYCLVEIYNKIKFKKLSLKLFLTMVIIWLTITFIGVKNSISYQYQSDDEVFLHFQNYLKYNDGRIWLTNPLYALYSDNKIMGLLYFYSSENLINFINQNKENVDTILFNNCDIQCHPSGLNPLCEKSRQLLNEILFKFKRIYQKEAGSCRYEIYRKI